MTHNERVLRLLSDGQPHSHMEGYRLGVMLHSRVADLRRKGYSIKCWRAEDGYLYQLLNEPEETPSERKPAETRQAHASGSLSSEQLRWSYPHVTAEAPPWA